MEYRWKWGNICCKYWEGSYEPKPYRDNPRILVIAEGDEDEYPTYSLGHMSLRRMNRSAFLKLEKIVKKMSSERFKPKLRVLRK